MGGALSSQAFQNGLNLAENQTQSNNTNELGALSTLLNGGNATTNTGLTAGDNSVTNATSNFNIGENAGQGEQSANQANLTNEQQQYQAATNDPFAALNNYMGIVGSQNWGSSTTGQTQTTPSALSIIGGLLGAGGAAASGGGALGWKPLG